MDSVSNCILNRLCTFLPFVFDAGYVLSNFMIYIYIHIYIYINDICRLDDNQSNDWRYNLFQVCRLIGLTQHLTVRDQVSSLQATNRWWSCCWPMPSNRWWETSDFFGNAQFLLFLFVVTWMRTGCDVWSCDVTLEPIFFVGSHPGVGVSPIISHKFGNENCECLCPRPRCELGQGLCSWAAEDIAQGASEGVGHPFLSQREDGIVLVLQQ